METIYSTSLLLEEWNFVFTTGLSEVSRFNEVLFSTMCITYREFTKAK